MKVNLINELKRHETLLNENISDEELENLIDFVRNIDNEDIKNLSLKELKQLNEIVSNIIFKVKNLQTQVLNDIKNSEKKEDATKAYLQNEVLNNR